MDRRYLIATLAIIATFAVLSHELRDGKLVSMAGKGYALIAGRCGTKTSVPAKIVSQMRASFRPSRPEEAQMLAEMNLPVVRAEARGAALAAADEMRAAKCAREAAAREAQYAMREAQRSAREAERARRQNERQANSGVPIVRSIAIHIDGLPQIQEQLQMESELMQHQVELQTIKLQIAPDQLERAAEALDAKLDTSSYSPVISGSRCGTSRAWTTQMRVQANVMRNALHAVQNSLHKSTSHTSTGSSL